MKAKDYVAERGTAVTDWLTAHIEQQFGRVIDGLPRPYSQFGVPYDEFITRLDSRDDHAAMMHTLKSLVDAGLPPDDLKSYSVVWRLRPHVYAPGPDFAVDETSEFQVKVRFRLHVMPTLDPVVLATAPFVKHRRTYMTEDSPIEESTGAMLVSHAPAHLDPANNPPTVIDAPYVAQVAGSLTCTMGNWNGEPTSRTYSWMIDGALTGIDAPELILAEDDVGKVVYCTMTASNKAGTSDPVVSNEVAVSDF